MKKSSLLKIFALSGLLLPLLICCEKEEKEEASAVLPAVEITSLTEISVNTALITGRVVSDGGAALTSSGICWSTHENPTVDDQIITDAQNMGNFRCLLTGLNGNTVYFLRAFVTTVTGTSYSISVSFKTFPEKTAPVFQTVTDIDGNSYKAVTFGKQTWMVENLKTSKYRNGDLIPGIMVDKDWSGLTSGAFCWYGVLDPVNGGALYNWYAVNDPRSLAPAGWHIPTDTEWLTLFNYASGSGLPYNFLTNLGFQMTKGGQRHAVTGVISGLATEGYWWCTDEYTVAIQSAVGPVIWLQGKADRNTGLSVRCVKD